MWKTLLRKYRFFFVVLLLFLTLVTFVDKDSLVDNWRLHGRIRELEIRREYYLQRITEDSLVLERLDDPEFLERYAREQFFMKRSGETIYVVR